MSTRSPWVSVVVPTFGRPAFLAEALDSILAQREPDLEVVVVDDASPQPVQMLRDPRVLVVRRTENGGPAAARNTGIDASRGEVVCFLDDDDLWLPHRLELASAGLQRAPLAICWTSFVHQPDGTGAGRTLDGDVSETILDGLTPSLGATAVRRADLVPFTAGMDNLEDVDWWWRMAQRSHVATEPVVGHRYRMHDGPRARTGLDARLAANEAFLHAHADWFAAHPRAAAFRWRRVGFLARAAGDGRRARRAFARSLRLHPSPTSAAHLARATAGR